MNHSLHYFTDVNTAPKIVLTKELEPILNTRSIFQRRRIYYNVTMMLEDFLAYFIGSKNPKMPWRLSIVLFSRSYTPSEWGWTTPRVTPWQTWLPIFTKELNQNLWSKLVFPSEPYIQQRPYINCTLLLTIKIIAMTCQATNTQILKNFTARQSSRQQTSTDNSDLGPKNYDMLVRKQWLQLCGNI